jgi:predicted ArsR family transcriptional regulator
MSRALRVTSADVRHHLSVLESERAVVPVGQKPKNGRGRPVQLYSLASTVERHNLGSLAHALLTITYRQMPLEERPKFLSHLAEALGETDEGTARNPTQRFYQAINILNEMEYEASWEARAGAPRIIFGCCPYAAILPEHPELCQLDARLIQHLTGVPSELLSRQELTPQGFRQCIFQLRKQ